MDVVSISANLTDGYDWRAFMTQLLHFDIIISLQESLIPFVFSYLHAQNNPHRPLTHSYGVELCSVLHTHTHTDKSSKREFKEKCLSFLLILGHFCSLLSCK